MGLFFSRVGIGAVVRKDTRTTALCTHQGQGHHGVKRWVNTIVPLVKI